MTVNGAPARPAGGGNERWHLDDERDFLRRSLADAEREHLAGDLSDADHAVLVARDTARLAEVEAELVALGPAPLRSDAGSHSVATSDEVADGAEPGHRWGSPWRLVAIAAACLAIAAGGATLAVHFAQSRQPGQAASGSVTLSQAQTIEQQLEQALTLNNEGDTKGALQLYDKVLSEDPSNPAALANAGFLQWNVGTTAQVASLVRIGRAEIETSVRDAPSYSQGHLFYGLVLENQDHNHSAAVTQFNEFLADVPAADRAEVFQAGPLVAPAYKAAGLALPAAFSSTTATSAP